MNYLEVSLSERMPIIIINILGILLMIYLEYRIFITASKRGLKFNDVVFGILLLIAIIVGIIVLLASNGLLS